MKTLYYWGQKLPINNKSKEVQIYTSLYLRAKIEFDIELSPSEDTYHLYFNLFNLFELNIIKNDKTDHAGFHFSLNILGLNFDYNHYDIRHWNYDNDDWEKYD
jgi:hypothetical protein